MADLIQEKWIKGVAITTTVLAVLTSIGSSRAGFCVAKSQVLTAQSGSQWAYYQAKSIKQTLIEMQHKIFEVNGLGSTTPEQKDLIQKNLQSSESEVARYEKEKNDIKKKRNEIEFEGESAKGETDFGVAAHPATDRPRALERRHHFTRC